MKVAVILNSAAGSREPKSDSPLADRIRRMFAERDCETVLYLTNGKTIASHVKKALESGVDVVVAGGGDGTISSVVRGVHGSDLALGVLPLGTLNHFAKDLGIPLDLDEAVRSVVTGVPKLIDIAEVNGIPFINNSSVGIYTSLVQARDALQRHTGYGKGFAMLAAGLRVFRRFPILHVQLKTDGETVSRRTPLVFVGNNEYRMDLFEQGARAHLDRGCLCLCVAQCDRRWSVIRLFVRFLLGRLEQARDFELKQVKNVRIESRRRNLHVAIDGEVLRLPAPLRYSIHPRALKVIVPPAAEVSQ